MITYVFCGTNNRCDVSGDGRRTKCVHFVCEGFDARGEAGAVGNDAASWVTVGRRPGVWQRGVVESVHVPCVRTIDVEVCVASAAKAEVHHALCLLHHELLVD